MPQQESGQVRIRPVDVGFAILIVALSLQQGLAYGWSRAIAIGTVLALYYLAARLIFWGARVLWRRLKRSA